MHPNIKLTPILYSDSGSVNSLPNNTTISMASVSQHMTLKAFKGMLKKSKNKKKINEGDTKSVDR